MDYKKTIPTEEIQESIGEIPPLSAFMDMASNLGAEALQRVYRLNYHISGLGEPKNNNTAEPLCFRDFMALHCDGLQMLNIELEKLMKSIGV